MSAKNEETTQLWKLNDRRANKEGHHAKVYWVRAQEKLEDGSNHRSQWRFSHSYQGGWEGNIKAGFGVQVYENGDKYEGEWLNNCRNGFGTYWVRNEHRRLVRAYTGQYLNDKKHGKGTMFFEDGRRYDGHWAANEITGFGRMIYTNGDVYVGEWRQDMRHGYGVFTRVNGDYYEGNWLLDKREGYGTHLFAGNGKVIVGEWADDQPRTSVLYKLSEDERQGNTLEKNSILKNQILKKRAVAEATELSVKFTKMMLPALQLENPIEVLESALAEVRRERLGFRVAYTPVELLVGEEELNALATRWKEAAGETGIATLKTVEELLESPLESAMAELSIDPEAVYFEDFVRLTVYLDSKPCSPISQNPTV